jgi:hypothetical protein
LLNELLGRLAERGGAPQLVAVCRYNLGLAYLRAGEERKAMQQSHEVIELLPNSLYARGAAPLHAHRVPVELCRAWGSLPCLQGLYRLRPAWPQRRSGLRYDEPAWFLF